VLKLMATEHFSRSKALLFSSYAVRYVPNLEVALQILRSYIPEATWLSQRPACWVSLTFSPKHELKIQHPVLFLVGLINES
jgi:hypothetical protein